VVVFSLLLTPCWVAHAVLGVTVHWAWWIGFAPFFIWHLFTIAFFRDPERLVPTGDNLIVSPADGVVTGTEEVDMPDFPGGRALRVSIFLSVFSVHINRAPFAMKTAVVRYYPGLFLDARHADCAERNEQLWVDAFAANNGLPIRLKQISGAIARRIVCWTKPGDGLNAGERFGLIKFGSRTDLLLPVGSATLRVKKGEGVWGGKTVLGEWKA
jgi:phosphatidylserine decarboxylase